MKKKLIYTSLLLSILTFASKILGFAKEALLAYNYGATYVTDGYLMTQNIITTIFSSFTTAIVIGYITTMSEKKDDNKTLNTILNYLFIFFTIIGCLSFVLAPLIIKLFAPGFDANTVNITVKMLRIILPFSVFYSFLYLISADLQTKNIFWHLGVFNLLTNIILVLTVALSKGSYIFLSIGYGISILIPALFVFFLNRSKEFKYKIKIYKNQTFTRNIIMVAYPIFFIEIFTNVMTLIDRSFASSIGEGIISNINYANRVVTLILTFFVSVISTVLLPTLVKKADKEDKTEFRNASSQIILYDLFIILFISIIVIVLNKEIVNFLFYRGAFSYEDSIITSELLQIYSIGLIALSLNSLLKSQLYSLKKSKSTMFCSVSAIILNVILDFVLVKIYGYRGLAIASVISAYVLTVLFFTLLFKNIKGNYNKDFYKNLYKILFVFVITLLCGFLANRSIAINSAIIKILVVAVIEFIIYILLLIMLRFNLIKDLLGVLTKRRNNNGKN